MPEQRDRHRRVRERVALPPVDRDALHGFDGRPEAGEIGFTAEASRLTGDELRKQEGQIDPSAPGSPSMQGCSMRARLMPTQ